MENSANRTLWVGGLSEKVTEELLYELFLQCGPIERVTIPKDKETGRQKSFGFVNFKHEASVPYTQFLLEGVKLFNRSLMIRNKTGSEQSSAKSQAENQNYGLGLLPHPSLGKGVMPADLSQFMQNDGMCEYSDRRFENGNNAQLMMPPVGYPIRGQPPMMGFSPGMGGMPPGYVIPNSHVGMMSPGVSPGMVPQMSHMAMPRMSRSQTWHGDISNPSSGSRGTRYDDNRRDDSRRHNDRRDDHRRDKRDRSPTDGRHGDKRSRHDDRERAGGEVRSRDRYGDDRGGGSRRGSHPHQSPNVVDMQQMALIQMNMLAQQSSTPSGYSNRNRQRHY